MNQPKSHLPLILCLALGAPSCLQASSEPGGPGDQAEDAETDKAPLGFGIEPDAPDGLAVLKIANTFTVTKLVAAGLTKNVAKRIVKARGEQGAFATLAALDKVPYVGIKVFSALRWHATVKQLYPTTLRIPVVTEYGEALAAVANDALVAAGLAPLPAHAWIADDMTYYELRSQWADAFAEAGVPAEFEAISTATLREIDENAAVAGAPSVCWIGNPWDVADLLWAQTDGLLPDEYSIWGWRVGKKVELDPELAPEALEGMDAWNDYDTASNEVLVLHTTYHDGLDYDLVPACRNPR